MDSFSRAAFALALIFALFTSQVALCDGELAKPGHGLCSLSGALDDLVRNAKHDALSDDLIIEIAKDLVASGIDKESAIREAIFQQYEPFFQSPLAVRAVSEELVRLGYTTPEKAKVFLQGFGAMNKVQRGKIGDAVFANIEALLGGDFTNENLVKLGTERAKALGLSEKQYFATIREWKGFALEYPDRLNVALESLLDGPVKSLAEKIAADVSKRKPLIVREVDSAIMGVKKTAFLDSKSEGPRAVISVKGRSWYEWPHRLSVNQRLHDLFESHSNDLQALQKGLSTLRSSLRKITFDDLEYMAMRVSKMPEDGRQNLEVSVLSFAGDLGRTYEAKFVKRLSEIIKRYLPASKAPELLSEYSGNPHAQFSDLAFEQNSAGFLQRDGAEIHPNRKIDFQHPEDRYRKPQERKSTEGGDLGLYEAFVSGRLLKGAWKTNVTQVIRKMEKINPVDIELLINLSTVDRNLAHFEETMNLVTTEMLSRMGQQNLNADLFHKWLFKLEDLAQRNIFVEALSKAMPDRAREFGLWAMNAKPFSPRQYEHVKINRNALFDLMLSPQKPIINMIEAAKGGEKSRIPVGLHKTVLDDLTYCLAMNRLYDLKMSENYFLDLVDSLEKEKLGSTDKSNLNKALELYNEEWMWWKKRKGRKPDGTPPIDLLIKKLREIYGEKVVNGNWGDY